MIDAGSQNQEFFVVGGTVRPDSPSYVERPADGELFQLAQAGQFCYVLATRQMGKSSLMMRADQRLREQGMRTVKIDLTLIGVKGVTIDQWYLGLLTYLQRKLRLSVDAEAWWTERAALSAIHRFTTFLRDIVLTDVETGVVIFIDEIDSTLNLDFTDDFFAAIRAIYNARAGNPEFNRLTFVLLGVATPADLIKDPARTPFNIGQGIDLHEFRQEDAQIFHQGLKQVRLGQSKPILERIFYWTNGHPYLTQKLCKAVVEAPVEAPDQLWTDRHVDALVQKLFLSEEGRQEENMQFIQTNVNKSPHRVRLLSLYRKIYRGKLIAEDKRSLDQNYLKLSGLVRAEKGYLQIRNEIYCQVFNLNWVKANTPVDLSRRIAIIATLVTFLLILALVFAISRPGQNTTETLAQTYEDTFKNTSDPTLRLDNLAKLFSLPELAFEDRAHNLFESLTLAEKIALFSTDTLHLQPQVRTVVHKTYVALENTEADNRLLQAMANALDQSKELESVISANEIARWLDGRLAVAAGNYEEAKTAYSNAIDLNDENPATYFERALTLAALEDYDSALTDFESVLNLNKDWKERVADDIKNNSELYIAWWRNQETHLDLVALVLTPTNTPAIVATATATSPTPKPTVTTRLVTPNIATATATPKLTATPRPTSTPTPTSTPILTRSSTSTSSPTVTPSSTPTDTPTQTRTLTPTTVPLPADTPTPYWPILATPKPLAKIIYAQGNGKTHDLGIVNSNGVPINITLPKWAAAPAWSPDGTKIAFFGEPSIDSVDSAYNGGEGLWVITSQGENPNQLVKTDHIKNVAWSYDGQKLAFEVSPPKQHAEIIVIDALDGRPLSRFSGQQPGWSPDNQQLAIKACLPECGLWQINPDGSGGQLLTQGGTDSYPIWSPDGRFLVFASERNGNWDIYLLRLFDNYTKRLTSQSGIDTTPVFSSDSQAIYYRANFSGADWRIMGIRMRDGKKFLVKESVGPSDDWGLARPAVH